MTRLHLLGASLALALLLSAFSALPTFQTRITPPYIPQAGPTDPMLCPVLAPPTGNVITVSSEAALRNQAYTATENTTIMIQPGVYNLTSFIKYYRG